MAEGDAEIPSGEVVPLEYNLVRMKASWRAHACKAHAGEQGHAMKCRPWQAGMVVPRWLRTVECPSGALHLMHVQTHHSQDKLNGISFEKGCYVGQASAILFWAAACMWGTRPPCTHQLGIPCMAVRSSLPARVSTLQYLPP